MANRQGLSSKLAKAHQQLKKAQVRVADLEAQGGVRLINPTLREEHYQSIFDNMVEGCQMIGFDWRYLYVNETAARHGQRAKDELLGYTMMERYPGIEKTPMFAVLQRCMQERTVESLENEFFYPDGTSAWFELRVQPVQEGIFILSLDITARKQAEAAERESGDWIRLALNVSNLGKWQHTIATGLIRFDERAQIHYGFTTDTVTLDRVLNQLHPDDVGRLAEEIAATINPEHEGRYATEYRVIHPDGSVHWLAIQAQVYFEGSGDARQPLNGFGTSQEITERKHAEEQIRKLNRTLGVLSDINQAIVRIRHLPTLFEKACAIAVEKGAFRMAWIGLLDVETGRVKAVAQAGVADDYLDKVEIVLRDGPQAQHPLATTLGTGLRWVCNDLATAPQLLPWHDDALRLGYRAAAAWPLMIAGEVQGIFKLYANEPEFFNEEELRLIDELAEDISFAMEIAQHEDQRRQAEAAVRRYAQRMEILHQIDLGLIQGGSIPAMVETTVKHLRQLIPCQRTDVLILDETTGEALIFAVGLDGDTQLGPGVRVPIPPDVFAGYDARHLRVFDDIRPFQATRPRARQLVNDGLLCALSALLMDQDRPIGVLGLFADTPGFFTAEHQAIAAEVASQLAIAIKQLHLSEELERYAKSAEAMRQFLQTTLDAFPAHTTVLDPQGTILNVNLSWSQFADENDAHAPTHYLGTNYLTVCDTAAGPTSEEAPAAAAGIRAVIAGQQNDFYLEYPCHSPTQARWFILQVTPFAEPAPRRVVVAHINITERKMAEEAEREQRLLAEALRDSLAVLTTSLEVETVMQQILAYSATVIPSEAGTIILFEGNQGRVAYARGHTAEAEAFFKATLILLEAGKFAQRDNHKGSYLAADTHSTPGWVSFPVTEWVRSSIGVPIVLRGETIGLLIADSGIPNRFQPEDVEHLQAFAQYAALALENAQHVAHLEQRVKERTTELQAEKERVEAILDNSGEGILLAYSDFTVQQTNAAFNRLFACETDTYFNQPLTALFQAQEDDLITKTIQTGMAEGQVVNLEVHARRQDDTAFDAELTIGFIKKGGFVCSIRDITQRKAQERQLRYHASLQENVSDAVTVTDMDFRIQSWNQAAERIYGWRAEEVIGKVAVEVLRTEFSSSADRKRNLQQLHEQGWWQGEVIQHHKDGNVRHILGSLTVVKDESELPFGIVSVNHDITERKQVENELAEERNRLRALIDTVPDFIYIKDRQHRFILCNQAVALAHGHQRPDEMIHKSDFDYFPAELAEQFRAEEVEILHTGKAVIDQEESVNGYRGFMWVLSSKFPLRNLNGEIIGLVGTTRDISERKQVEAVLQKSSAEIHDLYNHAPCGYHSIDQDGLIVQINDTELSWLGYNRDEVINKLKFMDILTPESAKIFQKNFPILKERGWVNGLEFDVIRKDSTIMHILLNATVIYDENGQYLRSRSSVFDITTLKQAQQALVESEARYRLLAENVTDVIVKSDIHGIRTFVTPSATTLTGYTPKELIEGVTLEMVHPDDRLASESIVLQALNSAESSCILTQRVHHKEGHYVWVEVTTSIVRDASTGKPTELISVFRDISERKRAEAILNARLEEEHEFQSYLKALHEITIELTQIDELDAFYQRAVELGLARLGFERLAMFLYNEKDKTALGTYGTDTQGKVVDERHVQFAPDPNGPMLRAFNQAQRFYFDENVPLYNDLQPVGFGWNAATVLWNGTRSLGWFVADNLLYQTPASKPLLNAMGLYALTVGSLLAQKQVQIELRESEARYRLLAENITDVVMRTNAALECVYISPSSRTVLGYETDELVGSSVFTYIHPDDQVSLEQALAASIQQNLSDLSLIVRYQHKQGHYVWLESTGRVIRSEKSGEVEGFISSSRDISKRKQVEEALRESEEKFRLLLDAAPVATIISDQMGRITLVNIQAETLFGFTRAELVGQMVEILVPEHAHDLHVYNRATYMAAPRVRQTGIGLEVFARRKDGSEFPVEIELSYIQTKDGILVMSFVLDITERRRIAAELESQRSFLRSVIDVSPSMIFVKDYNARFVLVNPMTAKMYNTTVEALIGKTDADFNPSLEEVDHYLEADRRVIDTGELLFVEEPITNFAGETHWLQTTKVPIVSADGKSNYVLGVATDITERRRAEAALQASEEKYRRLVETMQGGLAIFDLEDRITYVNDRFCALLGYSRDELIGTRSYDYTHDTNVHIIDAQLERRRNLESSSYEILVRHKEGRSVHLLVSASPLLDKNGEYSGSFAVTTDISAQKQAEETLQQALAQEKELGELKSRFVSMASHEFRTPLATILALTETLSAYRNRLSEAQIEQRFDKIKDQVGHLRDIMEDMLLLARMQARRVESNPVNLDLDDLCRTVLDEFQNRADVKHRLDYECSESGRKVTLDPKLMRQIISNLVSNAIKYSADDKPIHITLEFAAEAITVKVRDEGIGIPEADLKHLFEPFHRAANVGNIPGTGLGLVITRESVELLGGMITVESRVARGTTFTIHIPIST